MHSILLSIKEKITALFSSKTQPEIHSALREQLEKRTAAADEIILHALKAEKNFHKNAASFAGETFFRVVVVLTDKRILVLKDSSSYHELKIFPLFSVESCAAQSDTGKPALAVTLAGGAENRCVFSSAADADVFEESLAEFISPPEKADAVCGDCGNRVPADAKFCASCGKPLDFSGSENTM
ncbi:MAG: zinc-ribbon domain-containing protein [Thermodesulfobacteriota bacterium]